MNFFQSQDDARRNTKLLVVLFIAAVLCIIALVNLLVLVLGNFSHSYTLATGTYRYGIDRLLAVSAIVLLLIIGGSLYRIASLAGGGDRVAEMLDGRLLTRDNAGFSERRLLNVVEEMAIASGTPVPPVYLIPDLAINAFAAGYSPSDAVIGVTEGAVDNLNRDQLQGVIAHEFSHILNGDMRLNIRLMGTLYGILMLTVIGRILVRSVARSSSSRRSGGGGAVLAMGLGLVVVGYAGHLFGNLIKAAVSRQREFLADASAVQFTRNPEGIGGALRRIGGFHRGSRLHNAKSEELSHALFSQGLDLSFAALTATHPPLDKRIRRILPYWDGTFHAEAVPDREPEPERREVPLAAMAATGFTIDGDEAVGFVGNPDSSHIAQAQHIVGTIPAALSEAAREPYSARALVYLILLDDSEEVRSLQLARLEESADPQVFARLSELVGTREHVDPRMRLPLLAMALPSLRQLTPQQYKPFKDNIDLLILADRRVRLSEWALRKFVVKHLNAALEGGQPQLRSRELRRLRSECECLLSLLAHADLRGGDPARAFELGAAQLDFEVTMLDRGELSLTRLERSLDALSAVRPLSKPRLLKACVATITADGMVTAVEAELVRAIADSLDCPMPPITGPRVA